MHALSKSLKDYFWYLFLTQSFFLQFLFCRYYNFCYSATKPIIIAFTIAAAFFTITNKLRYNNA